MQLRRLESQVRVLLFVAHERLARAIQREVHVTIDETGQQKFAFGGNDARTGGHSGARPDRRYASAADDNRRVGNGRSAGSIDECCSNNRGCVLRMSICTGGEQSRNRGYCEPASVAHFISLSMRPVSAAPVRRSGRSARWL